MATPPGTRIGPYVVGEKIGEGGMGEVYRASDTKLKRDVALKLLPAAFTADPERLARFERESHLLAQLHHPNIAAIFGIEESEGIRALVMELVEGPTLHERMARGRLPVDEALGIALQIAEALEEAHGKGIVHRDLKPANIKCGDRSADLSPSSVKVLDFGLAKVLDSNADTEGAASPSSLANSPTLTAAATQMGMILGTASYMAPEQARGMRIDKRADVWAFGAVLFEMLAGERLFDGETVSDVLAGVLKTEIDFDRLPSQTPPAIRRLLRRCLERKPKDRLHDIADARIVIQETLAGKESEQAATVSPPAGRTVLPWVVAAVAVAALAVLLILQATLRRTPGQAPTYELALSPPDGGQFLIGANAGWGIVDPAGTRVVVRATTDGGSGLWVRSLDGTEQRLLPNTENGFYPLWSPDGRWVAFFDRGNLQRIEVDGGLPEKICVAPWGRGGSWSSSGRILFTPNGGGAIHVVDANGGEARPVTQLDRDAGEDAHYWAAWLPDGEHFLYFIRSSRRENQGIYLGRVPDEGLDEGRRRVVATSSSGVLVPGSHPGQRPMLMWVQEGTLLARELDPDTGALSGPTSRIADGVRVMEAQLASMVSASNGGTLVWASSRFGSRRLAWYDRDGRGPEIADTPEASLYSPKSSPDGRLIGFTAVEGGQGDLWVLDTRTGETRALTSTSRYEENAVWSPDSQELVFQRGGLDDRDFLRMRVDGSDTPRVLRTGALGGRTATSIDAWLPGGWLVMSAGQEDGTNDLVAIRADGGDDAVDLIVEPGDQFGATTSADGRAMAYQSVEDDRRNSFLASLSMKDGRPVVGPDRRRVPVEDVEFLQWGLESDQIYAMTGEGSLFAIPVEIRDGSVRPGTPLKLFDVPSARSSLSVGVAPHGQRFLLLVDPEAAHETLTVLTNWRSRLD